jgi:hypothetical protein
MHKYLIIFAILFLNQLTWAQIKVGKHAQLTFNKDRNEFFVMDDSTHYWTQKPGSRKWVKHPFHYEGIESFKSVMVMTKVVAVNQSTYYFVHESCGNVYALYRDTLKRIDHSFPHRNQYAGIMFPWNNSVNMFGGYGFFQVKNIFTRYNSRAKEWFEIMTNSNELPPPRSSPAFLVGKNELFIMGGTNRSHLQNDYLKDCWSYDFRNHEWKERGKLNEELVKNFHLFGLDVNLPNDVLRYSDRLIEFDLANNKWSLYRNPYFLNMKTIISSASRRHLMYALRNSNNNEEFEVFVQPLSELKEVKIGEYPICQKLSVFKLFPKEDYLYLSLTLNFILFMLLFYIRRMHKLTFLQRAQKKLLKSDFTKSEWEVICMIQQHREMELSALNEYFNEVGLSYETLKKRRETFIKNIRIKIALITRKPIEEILVESKHQVDKRMKIIHWNHDIELETE